MEWPADKIERKKVNGLIPYARNARTHSWQGFTGKQAKLEGSGETFPIIKENAA